MGTLLLWAFIVSICSGMVATVIAEMRGASSGLAFLAGALLGPLGIVVAFLLEVQRPPPSVQPSTTVPSIDVPASQPKASSVTQSAETTRFVADEIRRLGELWKDGLLTEDEFAAQKAKLLA